MSNLLHNLYLFDGLDAECLALIDSITKLQHYQTGDSIFDQDEEADSFYFIQYGSVAIKQLNDEGVLFEVATFGTGSHFGELALLDGEPRSAFATAASESDIIKIPYSSMNELLESNATIALHFYQQISRFLCSRLRHTTLNLGYSISQNLQYL